MRNRQSRREVGVIITKGGRKSGAGGSLRRDEVLQLMLQLVLKRVDVVDEIVVAAVSREGDGRTLKTADGELWHVRHDVVEGVDVILEDFEKIRSLRRRQVWHHRIHETGVDEGVGGC